MDIRFPVRWRQLWRSLTIYMSLAILVPLVLSVCIRAWRLGAEEGFRHVSPFGAFVGVVATVGFAALTALGLALVVRGMAVRVTDEHLDGRNYWCLKKRIPLREIVGMSRYSSHGIEAVVVASRRHGKIYIPLQTEHLNELVELLATYLPKENSLQPADAANAATRLFPHG